jgi:GTP-binding protein Era
MVLIDTPGYQLEHVSTLNLALNRAVAHSTPGADVTLWVVEALKLDERDMRLRGLVGQRTPLVVAVNKIDRVRDKGRLLPFLQDVEQRIAPCAIVPVSARPPYLFRCCLPVRGGSMRTISPP